MKLNAIVCAVFAIVCRSSFAVADVGRESTIKDLLVFSDSRGVKFTFMNFQEKTEKSYGTKFPPFRFIVVYTPSGRDPNFRKQNAILDSIDQEFENLSTVVIVGCAKLCVLSGYKIENPSQDLIMRFKIQIFDASGPMVIESDEPLSKKSILKAMKRNAAKPTSEVSSKSVKPSQVQSSERISELRADIKKCFSALTDECVARRFTVPFTIEWPTLEGKPRCGGTTTFSSAGALRECLKEGLPQDIVRECLDYGGHEIPKTGIIESKTYVCRFAIVEGKYKFEEIYLGP